MSNEKTGRVLPVPSAAVSATVAALEAAAAPYLSANAAAFCWPVEAVPNWSRVVAAALAAAAAAARAASSALRRAA